VQPYRWMIHDDISHMYHADIPTCGRRGGEDRTGEENWLRRSSQLVI
jgi:hypothetical protein